jgi:hypothetical protein
MLPRAPNTRSLNDIKCLLNWVYIKISRLWRWYVNVTITLLDIIHLIFKTQLYRFVHTSQEPHHVSATSPTDYWYLVRSRTKATELVIGLWRWYINITITILDTIYRLVSYLELSSTLQVYPYLTRNTLRLRYEPKRLLLSIAVWRLYIKIAITIFGHYPSSCLFLKKKHDFSEPEFCRLETETSSFYWVYLGRFNVKTEGAKNCSPNKIKLIYLFIICMYMYVFVMYLLYISLFNYWFIFIYLFFSFLKSLFIYLFI